MLQRKRFRPSYIYWELCDACNLQCKHCFAHSSPQKKCFQDQSIILRKITELTAEGIVPIRFGGGEPLLHPNIFSILSECTQMGIPVAITTNGTLLNETNVWRLKESGLKNLTISIDGTEPFHEYLRGFGSFERAVRGLRLALSAGLRTSVSFTLTAHNYKNLSEYVQWFYQCGVKEYYVFRYIPQSIIEGGDYLCLDKHLLMEATLKILDLQKEYSDAKFHYEKMGHLSFLLDNGSGKASCNFSNGTITIKADGTVVVCAAISKALGNIYHDRLNDVFEIVQQEIEKIKTVPIECLDCSYVEKCRGGCKSYSYNMYKNYCHRDDCCYCAEMQK